MNIKLSEMNPSDNISVSHEENYDGTIMTVDDFILDYEYYKTKNKLEVYTVKPYKAIFDADYIIENAIENESQDMYEDWDGNIRRDITKEDIAEIQAIFNRILARHPEQNIAYFQDELIEIDI